ncbi:MAG: hypothetical protein ACRENZ_06705, partial [Thermodesulfobacteriota bacterium]
MVIYFHILQKILNLFSTYSHPLSRCIRFYPNKKTGDLLPANRIYALTLCLMLIFYYACSSPDEKANKLFVEASQLVESAKIEEGTSYSNAYKLYEKAQKKLKTIITEYPTSNIAVSVAQDNTQIGGYTISQFNDVILVNAKLKADADENPISCALFLAKTLENADKIIALSRIANAMAIINSDEALETINETVELMNKTSDGEYKDAILVSIADTYGKIGHYQEAFQITHKISSQYFEVYSIAFIGGEYAYNGLKEKSVETLNQALQKLHDNNANINKDQKDHLVSVLSGFYSKAGEFKQSYNLSNT